MATYYVSSVDGSDADAGTSWALAKQTITGALAVATTTGDVILVDSAHSYTTGAGVALAWVPSSNVHVSIISTDRTNGGVLAGARESSANDASTSIMATNADHSLYIQGMQIESGTANQDFTNIASVSGAVLEMVDCVIYRKGTGSGATSIIGTDDLTVIPKRLFRNCEFRYDNPDAAAYLMSFNGHAQFIDCTFTLNSGSPVDVAFNSAIRMGAALFVGCDLSQAWDGTALVAVGAAGRPYQFVNCKLPTVTAIPTGTWTRSPGEITLWNCDSGDTTYKYAHYRREGALTVDLATYASDSATVDGNALSWKIVTTADADEDSPFVTPWVSTWIDSTGSKTLSLEFLYDNASNYDDREIWAEIEYLGDASFPLSTVYSSRNANPFTGTGADLTAGSATWTEALTNDNKDKITTTVTVNQKGLARARLFVAVPSITIYLDPQLRVA